MLRLLLLLYATLLVASQQPWNAQTFPNPTAGQFKECKMLTHARICDPDGVLDDGSRSRLDYELQQLESRTQQPNARDFCSKKGITAAMAIARKVQGGTTEDVKAMANNMLHTWTLDQQCQKSIVIVVSTEDAKFWVARDDKVPVYANEFTDLFVKQKDLFRRKQYVDALKNLIQGTWELALSKQGVPRQQPGPAQPGRNVGPSPGQTGGGGGMKMPSIPTWLIVVVVFVVIPILLCCCCLYCCCCRGKGSGGAGGGGGRQPVSQDIPMGGGGVSGGGGGGRGPFGNFMSTMGGAGIGSMIGNFLSNRNRGGGAMGTGGMGGGAGGGDYQGGGAYPAPPVTYDDNNGQGGGGLYPSVPVKDEGGGGSWA